MMQSNHQINRRTTDMTTISTEAKEAAIKEIRDYKEDRSAPIGSPYHKRGRHVQELLDQATAGLKKQLEEANKAGVEYIERTDLSQPQSQPASTPTATTEPTNPSGSSPTPSTPAQS